MVKRNPEPDIITEEPALDLSCLVFGALGDSIHWRWWHIRHLPNTTWSTSPPMQHATFWPKSICNHTHVKGPYIQTFYQVVFSEIQCMCQQTTTTPHNHNLSPLERSSLKALTNNTNIVIKAEDKWGWDCSPKQKFLPERGPQSFASNTYTRLPCDPYWLTRPYKKASLTKWKPPYSNGLITTHHIFTTSQKCTKA